MFQQIFNNIDEEAGCTTEFLKYLDDLEHEKAVAAAGLPLMNPLIFAGTHIGQISWTNDSDREFHPSEAWP
jgi:hypothetical protein